MKRTIGFIGTGKMAEALIRSISKAKLADVITGSDSNKERLNEVASKTGIIKANDNRELAKNSNVIFLSVKPQDMKIVLEEIKPEMKNQLVLSIAAGTKISFIESILGKTKIVRVMPNLPCIAGEMAAGYSINGNVTKEDKEFVAKLLNSAGTAILLDENLLDAVTGLSGSGPAFFAFIINALAEAGVKQGLDKKTALSLALQTAKGTAKLLQESNMTPEELINMVSSPNGTTVAGRKILENSNLKEVLEKTVEASAKRSRELGGK